MEAVFDFVRCVCWWTEWFLAAPAARGVYWTLVVCQRLFFCAFPTPSLTLFLLPFHSVSFRFVTSFILSFFSLFMFMFMFMFMFICLCLCLRLRLCVFVFLCLCLCLCLSLCSSFVFVFVFLLLCLCLCLCLCLFLFLPPPQRPCTAAAKAPSRCRGEFILFTVTFVTNPANDLTCPPSYIIIFKNNPKALVSLGVRCIPHLAVVTPTDLARAFDTRDDAERGGVALDGGRGAALRAGGAAGALDERERAVLCRQIAALAAGRAQDTLIAYRRGDGLDGGETLRNWVTRVGLDAAPGLPAARLVDALSNEGVVVMRDVCDAGAGPRGAIGDLALCMQVG